MNAEQVVNYRLSKTPRASISSDKNSMGEMEIKVRSLLYRSTSSASFDEPIFDSINEIEKIRQQLRDEFTNIANRSTAHSGHAESSVPRLKSAQILNKINQSNNAPPNKSQSQKKSVSLDNYYYTQQLREKLKQIVKKQQLQYTSLSSQNKKALQINESKDKLSVDEMEDNSEHQFSSNNNNTYINLNETPNNNVNVANNNTNIANGLKQNQRHSSSRPVNIQKEAPPRSALNKDTSNANTNANPSRIHSSIRNLNPKSQQISYVGTSNNYNLNYANKRTPHLRNVPMFISGKSYSIPDVKLNQIKLKP